MAKVTRTGERLSGKIGDKVYVNGKYGPYVRNAPAKGTKVNEPAFKQQHRRTPMLNKLASELNKTIEQYGQPGFKRKSFYQEIQKRFRKEPLDNRFFLLQQLKGMEVNPRYAFGRVPYCSAHVSRSKNTIIVELHVKGIPDRKNSLTDCYYYEVILLHWTPTKKPAAHSSQLTTWIPFTEKKPGFEFLFPVPKTTVHWLLCLRIVVGMKEKEIGDYPSQGMQLFDMGTFDKKEQALFQQRMEEKSKKPAGKKKVVEKKRVGPKWE